MCQFRSLFWAFNEVSVYFRLDFPCSFSLGLGMPVIITYVYSCLGHYRNNLRFLISSIFLLDLITGNNFNPIWTDLVWACISYFLWITLFQYHLLLLLFVTAQLAFCNFPRIPFPCQPLSYTFYLAISLKEKVTKQRVELTVQIGERKIQIVGGKKVQK